MASHHKVVDILLVEDNPGDALLVRKAFELAHTKVLMHTVDNGEEALHYLRNEAPYQKKPRPDLIILDLNMPKLDGREVLAVIKQDPRLETIPVIIMSSSEDQHDIDESYRLHVNCFIVKPTQVRDFLSVIKAIEYFWTGVVSLPDEE
jgi:CheY-like chemotaxis protein